MSPAAPLGLLPSQAQAGRRKYDDQFLLDVITSSYFNLLNVIAPHRRGLYMRIICILIISNRFTKMRSRLCDVLGYAGGWRSLLSRHVVKLCMKARRSRFLRGLTGSCSVSSQTRLSTCVPASITPSLFSLYDSFRSITLAAPTFLPRAPCSFLRLLLLVHFSPLP